MIGSHLDTVPNSGAFDGVLGVMMGLALIESLELEKLPFAIELVAFSEEEGVRYSLPFIGSRALVGRLDAELLETKDGDGISLARALTSFGLDPSKLDQCVLSDDVAGYLEFHIEQGVLLESEDRSLGVVQAIAGQTRAEITFTGRARHAGTTPMRLRNDAVAGAAEWISEVERVALATPRHGGHRRRSAHPPGSGECRCRTVARQPGCTPWRRRGSPPGGGPPACRGDVYSQTARPHHDE